MMVFIAVSLREFVGLVEILALLDDLQAQQIAGGGDLGSQNLLHSGISGVG